MGAPRRRALEFEEARAALRLVHSEEYTEKILVCIIQAEELTTKIFIANKERAAEQLSLSMRAAVSPAGDDGVPGVPDGTAMQSQDLNEFPAAHPQQGARDIRQVEQSVPIQNLRRHSTCWHKPYKTNLY
jgi:hypothetical protein